MSKNKVKVKMSEEDLSTNVARNLKKKQDFKEIKAPKNTAEKQRNISKLISKSLKESLEMSLFETSKVLSLPENKEFYEMPINHYIRLVEKHGYPKVIKALLAKKRFNEGLISEKASAILSELRNIYRAKEQKMQESLISESLGFVAEDLDFNEEEKSKFIEAMNILYETTGSPYQMNFNNILELEIDKWGHAKVPYYAMDAGHYSQLVDKHGYQKVMNALHNLYVLFKNRKGEIRDDIEIGGASMGDMTLGQAARAIMERFKSTFEHRSRTYARRVGKQFEKPKTDKEEPKDK